MPNPEPNDRESKLIVPDFERDHIGWLIFKHTVLNPSVAKTAANRPPSTVTRLTGKKKEEVNASLAQFQKEFDFFQAHYTELLEKHPDQWVGILDERVAGVADSFDELLETFRDKGIPTNSMYVKRLTVKRGIGGAPTI